MDWLVNTVLISWITLSVSETHVAEFGGKILYNLMEESVKEKLEALVWPHYYSRCDDWIELCNLHTCQV